eukprot:11412528-Alexandrium_andersonii.AAC.1
MQNRFTSSKLELRGPRDDLKFHPGRSRPGDSASFCALSPMVTMKRAGGCAGGASWEGSGGAVAPHREDGM